MLCVQLTSHMESMLEAAYSKYTNWHTKRSQMHIVKRTWPKCSIQTVETQKSLICSKAINYAFVVIDSCCCFKVPIILVPWFALHEQFILRYQSWELDWHVAVSFVHKSKCLRFIKFHLWVKYFYKREWFLLTTHWKSVKWYYRALCSVHKLFKYHNT